MREYWAILIYKNFVCIQSAVCYGSYNDALNMAMRMQGDLHADRFEINHRVC